MLPECGRGRNGRKTSLLPTEQDLKSHLNSPVAVTFNCWKISNSVA